MWIERTKTGYRLCDRVKIDGKIKRVTVPLEKDTAQARRKATEALNEKIRTLEHKPSKKPLKDLVELYLDKKKCKESTRYVVGKELKRMLEIIGDVSIDAGEINRAILESDVPPQTINRYLKSLKAFLRWSYLYGYISTNIADKILPLPSDQLQKPSEEKYLEPDELQSVLNQLGGMPYYLTRFLALTGCRIGEAAALNTSDITDRYVIISKTYNERGGVTSPKTVRSNREIYIQPELRELLNEYTEWRLVYMMSKGIRTDLLFFTRDGQPYTSRLLRHHYLKLESAKHIHPHIFRHTHTAILAAQGVSLEAISRRLGHDGDQITRDVYYHVTAKQKEKDEQSIAAVRIL